MCCTILAAFILLHPAYAGILDDFENDATKQRPPAAHDHRHASRHHGHGFWDAFWEGLFHDIFRQMAVGVVVGGPLSWERVQPRESANLSPGLMPRQHGEALISFARIDVAYQFVESDVDALDYRAEFGYGPFAIQTRYTCHQEKEPPDELDVSQLHFLYRMSFGNTLEMDMGVGRMTLTGNDRNSGFSFTMPILYHPKESAGVEFRPTWGWIRGNTIGDYDLSVLIGRRHGSLRVGYRWFAGPEESLNGPHVGLSLRY
jgi:hypothetical protein